MGVQARGNETEEKQPNRRTTVEPPKTKTVVVKQQQFQVPKGIRFTMDVDTSTDVYNISIVPESTAGMIAFLEAIRWAANQVLVDYDIKVLKPKTEQPVRIV